jgi:RHS repeat-associated protein
VTKPRGVQTATTDDFATTYTYDVLDRAIKQTEYGTSTAQARVTQLCYDIAGDLRSITSPRAGTATITCPGTGPAVAGFTSEFDYDDAHRQVTKRDELGHAQRSEYDANGNAIAREADITTGRVNRTEVDYDQRDMPVAQRERFDGTTGRNVTTRFQYDLNGNRTRIISPRAYDIGGANGPYTFYVAVNDYDAANQLVRTTLPYDGRDGTERQYVHRSYDANGNVIWSSLPVTQPDATQVGAGAKTTMTYFDTGWIRTSDDPANPAVHFDYTATGRQSQRTPEMKSAPGTLDTGKTMTWTFYADDLVESRSDQGGQAAQYFYDADNNLTSSTDSGGVTDASERALETQSTFTGFDEVAKTRHRKQTSTVWKFTDYTYDDNGNTIVRRENGEENDAGTQSKAPRTYQLTYDGADWLAEQRDLGTDSTCLNDSRTVNAFWGTGLEKQRDTYRAGATCTADPATWAKKQTTTWTHFDNGKLRTLTTQNGSGTTTETHTVSYFDTANPNIYLNGNRTKDTQGLTRGAGSTATTCTPASPCDAVYTYDARDKLLSEARNGKTTTYKFDEPADQLGDNTIRAGNVTTQIANGVTTTQRYTGNQLTDITAGGATVKYWYDDQGNQDCITTATGSQANCNTPTPTAAVLADYTYDYLNRLSSVQQFAGGAQTDKSSYVYDALDRTTIETEDHAGSANDRKTDFTYQGLSSLLTEEKQSGGSAPKTKAYSYDNFGHRLGMTDTDNGTGAVNGYSYGTDVHGSISQLIDDAGTVKASYGYSAYGGADSPSTDAQSMTSGDTNAQAPINPMRFSGKRTDSGTANSAAAQPDYDMGARRYGPNTGRFLQADAFAGALGDLGLALDPLTQNRYALAAGNPISYVETDGHMAIADGGGGGSTPAPPPPPAEPSLKDKALNLLGGLWNSGKDKVEDKFKDVKDALDELDAKTVDNPDWALHGVYEGWKKFEEKAEPIVGATDVYNCIKTGQGGSCAWGAAAFIPGTGLGKGALSAALRTSVGKKALARGAEFLAKRLPVSTGVDKAVFYSGAGMQDKALAFASSMAKTPIDKTIGGRVLAKLNLFDHLSYPEARRPWEMMSQRYAEQASGNVSAFISNVTSGTGVFAKTELPALMDNPAVHTINGASKSFFEHWFGGLIS